MRTLFISTMVPYPLNTGINQRIYHLLRSVASVSEVTFVAFLRNEAERGYVQHFQAITGGVHLIPPVEWGIGKLGAHSRPVVWARSLGRSLHPSLPYGVQWYRSNYARDLIARLCGNNFDLIWAGGLPCVQLLPAGLQERTVIDLADLEHRKAAYRLRRSAWCAGTPLQYLDYVKLKRMEQGLLEKPYEYVVCSSIDKAVLGGSDRVWVVPNGVDIPETRSHSESRTVDAPVFVFVGLMNYDPNVDGICHFVNRIFPLILRQAPGAQLLIVGRDPVPAVNRLHNGRSIVVTGTVPTVAPYLENATALIVPIRFGGGTRIKILEAIAHKVPVVSTTIGAEGLDLRPGSHILIADDPAGFAAASLKLWREPEAAAQMARNAYDVVSPSYTWDSIGRKVQGIVNCERSRIEALTGVVMPDSRGA